MALTIKLTEDTISKPFAFTANCKDLETSLLKAIAALVPNSSGTRNFLIVATKTKKVYVAALGSDTFVLLLVPNAVAASSGAFSVESDRMLGIVKGRAVMDFNLTKNMECEFKLTKGKYSGKIVTLPITLDMISLFNNTFAARSTKDESVAPFSTETLDLIKEGLSLTDVKNLFNESSLLSYIVLNKGELSIARHDNHHFGYYTAKSDHSGRSFSIAAPVTHFQLIDKLMSGYVSSGDAVFTIQAETLRVDTNSFIAILPLMQSNEESFSLLPGFIAAIGKPAFRCSIDFEHLAKLTENLFTLYKPNTTFDFSYKQGSGNLSVMFVGPDGSASDQLAISTKCVKSLGVRVDPKVLRDSLTLIKDLKETHLHICVDKCIVLNAATKLGAAVTHVCSIV